MALGLTSASALVSLAPLCGAVLIYSYFSVLKEVLASTTGDRTASGWLLASFGGALVACTLWLELKSYVLFIWHCFLAPLGKTVDQKARLDKFYEGQAQIYDKTRAGLLRGRNTMLELSAAHLRVIRAERPNERLVWVDVGGGTGWNVEAMNEHFPISSFDAVYVVDLCKPLLDLAQKRFASRGWTNVICLCEDATTFVLPEWSDGVSPRGSLGFVTLSYSLSMIPSYHTLLDRLDSLLNPDIGLMAVVDFYTSGKEASPHSKAIGGESKQVSWLSRWFWQIWFDFDHVDLSPGRRDYLEYRFGTVKSFNGRNRFVLPFIVRIPYYIWIGRSRARDGSGFLQIFESSDSGSRGRLGFEASPTGSVSSDVTVAVPELDLGPSVISVEKRTGETDVKIAPPLSSFHYQVSQPWRLPYLPSPTHAEFRTFIYSFTWEDPEVDMQHLQLTENDSIFAITSAGDNVLHYAINAKPREIHAVDMNPCQGHLLELKLAALKALSYDDFFSLFGAGSHPSFLHILNTKLSPFLSSPAYQFWRTNASEMFNPSSSFYLRGYSGWALRIAHWLIFLSGRRADVQRLLQAQTIEEQDRIWKECLRGLFVKEGGIVRWLVNNPVFLWNALGVPRNQKNAFLEEGSVYEFIRDTLDPIGSHALLSKGAYHYLLCLLGHYTTESCPDYLTKRGFEILKADAGKVLDAFRLHTDSIVNVLRELDTGAITRAVIMDHLDWFAPDSNEVDAEVSEMHRVLVLGGMVFWRSAARRPWYNAVFERVGFRLEVLGMREGPEKAIDRVNMYASFWKATKI